MCIAMPMKPLEALTVIPWITETTTVRMMPATGP